MITTTLSTYPGKKVVKDLGIVFAYDDAVRPTRLAMNMDLRDTLKPMLMGTAVILEDESS